MFQLVLSNNIEKPNLEVNGPTVKTDHADFQPTFDEGIEAESNDFLQDDDFFAGNTVAIEEESLTSEAINVQDASVSIFDEVFH